MQGLCTCFFACLENVLSPLFPFVTSPSQHLPAIINFRLNTIYSRISHLTSTQLLLLGALITQIVHLQSTEPHFICFHLCGYLVHTCLSHQEAPSASKSGFAYHHIPLVLSWCSTTDWMNKWISDSPAAVFRAFHCLSGKWHLCLGMHMSWGLGGVSKELDGERAWRLFAPSLRIWSWISVTRPRPPLHLWQALATVQGPEQHCPALTPLGLLTYWGLPLQVFLLCFTWLAPSHPSGQVEMLHL